MTAATLDLLSGGRFLLGLGTSGPQVVEGWHGEPWGKPLGKTREYVEIVRAALRREVVEHHGEHYDIPFSNGTGLGKPLKLMARPLRAEIPIYLASLGPKAVELAFEIADGWLPIFFSPEKARALFPLDRAREGFDIAPACRCSSATTSQAGDRPAEAVLRLLRRRHGRARAELLQRPGLALRLRGGGAARAGSLPRRQAARAAAAVPDALVDELALSGRASGSATGSRPGASSGVTTLLAHTRDPASLRTLAELAL